ncbi:MAG: hypothetical protein U1E86_03460 [Burkholderiaceae bacterium]
MSTETLSSLAHETVEIYARTAKVMVDAYRTTANKALEEVSARLGQVGGKEEVEQPVKSSLVKVGKQVVVVIGNRVDAFSSAADDAIEMIAKGTDKALGTFTQAADKFYDAFPGKAGEFFEQVNLPAVRLSRDFAKQVARGADTIARRAPGARAKHGATDVEAKPVRAARKAPRRRAAPKRAAKA